MADHEYIGVRSILVDACEASCGTVLCGEGVETIITEQPWDKITEDQNKNVWSKKAVKMLLKILDDPLFANQFHENFRNKSKKRIWMTIKDIMKNNGIVIDKNNILAAHKVSQKWRNLIRTVKAVDSSKKSNLDKREKPFYYNQVKALIKKFKLPYTFEENLNSLGKSNKPEKDNSEFFSIFSLQNCNNQLTNNFIGLNTNVKRKKPKNINHILNNKKSRSVRSISNCVDGNVDLPEDMNCEEQETEIIIDSEPGYPETSAEDGKISNLSQKVLLKMDQYHNEQMALLKLTNEKHLSQGERIINLLEKILEQSSKIQCCSSKHCLKLK